MDENAMSPLDQQILRLREETDRARRLRALLRGPNGCKVTLAELERGVLSFAASTRAPHEWK